MTKNKSTIDQLIISSPYVEPTEHWSFDHATQSFFRKSGRRSAGYLISSQSTNSANDPGRFVELPLVNKIRSRVNEWRAAGYPGITGITKRLLDHWTDVEGFDQRQFFFCQLEAIETLIWLVEADPSTRVGIDVPTDGGTFQRLCSKMATGTGKTVVMAMVAAWQILNKVAYPKDSRFSKSILVIAPGVTVRSRLSVLQLDSEDNYYASLDVVPTTLRANLRQGRIIVRNWHSLTWDSEDVLEKRRSVDKRGPLSDEAYVRSALGELANSRDLIVINDEAHHAWRVPSESKIKGIRKEDIEEATKWVGAIDRIDKVRRVLRCFDFSATPFAPSGNRIAEEALFGWVVSDFGLNDAIEAGLVKTPRVVVRDNGKLNPETYKSLLYHLYDNADVKADLNRPADPEETLPSLILNAYLLLGYDWLETKNSWDKAGMKVPPVMISVVNRTETAARIKYAFDKKKIKIPELCDPSTTIHIDSNVLSKGESEEAVNAEELEQSLAEGRKVSKAQQAEILRARVNTIGRIGLPGEKIQNVISVGMLSEGWDAKTVTHIMGLRAFTSQLLCEQVIGRGLRRTSYEVDPTTGLFSPEYVNVFGIPFSFLPVEGATETGAKPSAPRIPIFPDPQKVQFKIEWPRVVRVSRGIRHVLTVDLAKIPTLTLRAGDFIHEADLAPTIDGKPNEVAITTIDLQKYSGSRMQRVIFEAARDVFDQVGSKWTGDKGFLFSQVVEITEKFINSKRLRLVTSDSSDEKKRLILTCSMSKIVQHISHHLQLQNSDSLEAIFDHERPIGSTAEAATWYTSKPCDHNKKSHINLCVFDSTWEKTVARELDRMKDVLSWVKNDHLGFEIFYTFQGGVRRYRPDFLVKLANGKNLILEVKGVTTEQDHAKWQYTDEWIAAVNNDGRFGSWYRAVSRSATGHDVKDLVQEILAADSLEARVTR